MSVYKKLLLGADKGISYKISLVDKKLIIDGKSIIKEGENKTDDKYIDKDDLENVFGIKEIDIEHDVYATISFLYQTFKHSTPNNKWNERKSYFKALKADELTEQELAFNCNRYFAQAMLEGYVLLASLQGWLEWKNEDHWFWVDKLDNDCVLLKNWIK